MNKDIFTPKELAKREGLIAEFFDFCAAQEVEFVDFRFSDIKGTWHHVSYSMAALSPASFHGIPFDGSSFKGWQGIEHSDMLLIPDPVRYFIDPFSADVNVIVFCDIYDIYNNRAYARCPRSIAKAALAHLRESGIGDNAYFGPENEFFIFDNIQVQDSKNMQFYRVDTEEGEWNRDKLIEGSVNTGHYPGSQGGYFPVPPVDSLSDIRAEMAKLLDAVGLETFVVHHEVGQGQCEIGVKYGDLLEAADNVQKLKYIVKMVAHLNGKTATFMPKPLYGDNGSGMHVHVSVWKDGKNLFALGDDEGKKMGKKKRAENYCGMSDMAMSFLAGVLAHGRSLAAFTNASSNSYKRLIVGFEAPCILTYSAQNRSASIRIPYHEGAAAKRFEFRFPDSSCNPYLAFSALLLAGLDGIQRGMEPKPPMDINLYKLTLDEIRAKGIRQLPHTLRSAMEEMLADHDYLLVSDVFSEEFIDTYKELKFKNEILPYEARPHPFEFITTYSC